MPANSATRTPGLAWGFSPTNKAPHAAGASAPGSSLLAPQRPAPENAANSTDPAYAPSFPAPPAPLTPEEKLLRRMVTHDTPVLLAALEPRGHRPHLPREPAEADAFFAAFLPTATPPGETSTGTPAPPADQPADQPSTDTTTNGDPQQ